MDKKLKFTVTHVVVDNSHALESATHNITHTTINPAFLAQGSFYFYDYLAINVVSITKQKISNTQYSISIILHPFSDTTQEINKNIEKYGGLQAILNALSSIPYGSKSVLFDIHRMKIINRHDFTAWFPQYVEKIPLFIVLNKNVKKYLTFSKTTSEASTGILVTINYSRLHITAPLPFSLHREITKKKTSKLLLIRLIMSYFNMEEVPEDKLRLSNVQLKFSTGTICHVQRGENPLKITRLKVIQEKLTI